MHKVACYLIVALLPLFTSFCVGQSTETSKRNKELLLQLYDSLERIQLPIREVSYSCKSAYVIRVDNQQQFDQMPFNLERALQDGKKNIKVKIKKGTYFFKDEYLSLKNYNCADADIRIEGDDVTIVPLGYLMEDGDEVPCGVSGESCFLNLENMEPIVTWGDMMYADSLVEVLDIESKICRVKCNSIKDIIVPENNQAYIDLTRWCRCYQYKVLKIENGYVYFYAHDLEKDVVFGEKEFNVNYDYIVSRANPRFRLCNVKKRELVSVIEKKLSLPPNIKSVYLADASSFMSIQSTRLHNLTIKGIKFLGSKYSDQPLFCFKYVIAENIEFVKCMFIGQCGKIMNIYSTDNLYFHDNIVKDNYDWGIEIDNLCSNAYVVNNTFENNGTNLSYNRCVSCSGKDYYIANNSFKNFGYCAISLGVWYGSEMVRPSGGIVEYNHIWYDTEHLNSAWKYTIMDAGAIYFWTQNENAIVRYNYIHDYTGMRHNRGIYCDDGAKGVKIYGNLVINISNGYAIDSRRVARTEMEKNRVSKSVNNNINNVIMYNLTDGTINFVGNEKSKNGCVKGENILIYKVGEKDKDNKYIPQIKNIELNVKDEEFSFLGYDERGIIVSEEVWKVMGELPCFEQIKRFVRVNKIKEN